MSGEIFLIYPTYSPPICHDFIPLRGFAKADVKAPIAKPTPSLAPALSKDERLMLLLARYKADQITPEQYHTQRAAILAEP